MSLHKFADMVAKQGRGDDSLLIHMTPDEVQRLQSFAQANGRSLTINPETGLPEAGMLSDLFKTIAPIALGAFLGPAGLAFGGPGLTAGMAGLATGGITALATGSLSRGLMAGLGAYGGAGIGESLMNAGTGALSQSVGAGLSEEAAQQAVASKLASATPMETLTAGFNSATATPAAMGTFAKNNLTNIGMAAAPIMAGAMVPTTTKMPENTNPAYIRQKLYDPYTQTYKSLAPVKANEWGSRSFSDAYTNPQTGGIASLDQRQTTPMAAGGIVALAGGGVSAEDIRSYLAANPGMSDADIASAMNQYGVSTADMAAATGSNVADIQSRYDAVQPAAPAPAPAVAEPVYTPPSRGGKLDLEPADETLAPSVAPVAPTAPVGIETLTAAMPPVAPVTQPTTAPVAPVTQPTAPAGIETLTAAMPPVAPVAPKVTDEQIKTWWSDPEHQKLSDAEIKKVMDENKVTPEQFANAIGANTATAADITSRYEQVGKPTGIQTLTADQTVTTADQKTTADTSKTGVFQTVYDPKTGREFVSPAQAAQYGVTDYVTSLPKSIALPASAQKVVDEWMAKNPNKTQEQALEAIGAGYGMTGDQFRNYEIQGTIRSADQQKVRDAVATQSGGLTPEQLTTKLQAFKDKPPTTAQEIAEQGALYSDYANRYANSNSSYSNMGGKAQDFSLKPAEYLATPFTGYAKPINEFLSSTNQKTPSFSLMQETLTNKPEINQAIQTVLDTNPNAFKGGSMEATIRNLSADIDALGSDAALKNFYAQQKNIADTAAKTQGMPTGVAALAANQPPTQAAAKPTGIETLTAAAPKYNEYTNEQIGKYLRDNPTADLAKAIKDTNADPAAVNKYIASLTTPFKGSTADERGSGTFGIYNQMKEQGIDPSEYFAAATANDPKYAGWNKDMIQEAYDLNKGMYALSEAKQGKVTDTDWAKLMVGKGTWDKPQYDPNEMAQATGLSIREVQARYDLEKLKAKAATPVKPVTPVTPAPTKVDGTKVTRVTEPTPIVTAPETALPPGVSGATGPSIVGGGTTVNPNGTITTSPRIPNIPVGGFTGMESLRDSYTKGGGSLGYTPKAPKTAAEHAVAYNRMTGDSAAAYNYLMGKGANPTQSVAASTSTGIMRPYFSEGMRYKPKFLSYDKEGNVTTSSTNPNAPKAGDVTNKPSAKSINVLDNQGNTVEAVLREDGKYHTSGGDTYDVTGRQIVAGGGMMGYANGGITGTGQLNLNIPLNLGGSGGGMGGTGGYNGYGAMGGGFGSSGGYQGQGSQNSVQQSGMPDFRNQLQGFESQIQKLPSVMSYNDYTKSVGNRPPTADEMAQIEQLRKGVIGDKGFMDLQSQMRGVESKYQQQAMGNQSAGLQQRYMQQAPSVKTLAGGGYAVGGGMGTLGSYSDGGRLLRGPGDGVSDSIPATIGRKQQPARLADGEFVIPARIVSELGNGSTDAGAKKLYAMMDRVQRARGKTTGKNKVAANSRADKYLPA